MNASSEFDPNTDPMLEASLRRDLVRVAAPEGFTDRVMSRVAAQQKETLPRLLSLQRRMIWLPIAAMLAVAIVLGGWQFHLLELRQQQQAALARQQFELAMQITGRTLAEVQQQIAHAGEIHNFYVKKEVSQ